MITTAAGSSGCRPSDSPGRRHPKQRMDLSELLLPAAGEEEAAAADDLQGDIYSFPDWSNLWSAVLRWAEGPA